MSPIWRVGIVVSVLALASRAGAQLCAGYADFEKGAFRAEGAIAATTPSSSGLLSLITGGGNAPPVYPGDRGSEAELALSMGLPSNSAFASAGWTRVSHRLGGDSAVEIRRLTLGYQWRAARVGICSFVSYGNLVIPEVISSGGTPHISFVDTTDYVAHQVGLGFAAGLPIDEAPGLQWRPSAALSLQRRSVTSSTSYQQYGTGAGTGSFASTAQANYGEFEVSIGLIARQLTLRPYFVYDFGRGGGDTNEQTIGLSVSINFGPHARPKE